MIKKMSDQRVAVLVDGHNILLSAKRLNAKPDYEKMLERINGRHVVRAITYLVDSRSNYFQSFKTAVNSLGFEIKSKFPKRMPNGTTKANWDIQICVDAMSLSDKVDVITLVSGDGDFEPLVRALQSKGVKVEVMSVPESTADELKNAADEWIPMTSDMMMGKVAA